MTENPLGYEKFQSCLKNFAVPSIVASLVGSIYNIVDQIFIGQGGRLFGNAATNVAYPFLPSALPLHYWSELAVLPVSPSVLTQRAESCRQSSGKMVLF